MKGEKNLIQLADTVTLAVLATMDDILAAPEDLSDFAAEKQARLAVLCGGTPSKQTLMSDLIAKDVLSACSPSIGALFTAMETLDTPVCVAAFAELSNTPLSQYVDSLRRGLFVKTTMHMQGMYSCVGFEKFQALTEGILPLESAGVTLLAQLKRADQVDVGIDFASRTITFNSGTCSVSSDLSALRRAARLVRAELAEAAIMESASSLLFDEEAFAARLDAERRAMETRREATQARKDALEQEAVDKAQNLSDQLAKAEEERLEADARARAAEVARKEALAKLLEEELIKSKSIVERMLATGGQKAIEAAAWTDEDLAKLGPEKLQEMHKEQLASERVERINKRRNESRRLEYTARLVRGAAIEQVSKWASNVFENDKAALAERAEQGTAASKREALSALLPFAATLSSWKDTKMEEYNAKVAAKAEEYRSKLQHDVKPMSRDEFKEMAQSLPDWKEADDEE